MAHHFSQIATPLLVLLLSFQLSAQNPHEDNWRTEINRFLESDKESYPKENSILFVGSSSIRLWKTLEADMAPLPVIQRGFGGCKLDDVVYFAPEIVVPYRPAKIVLFAGTNDIAPGNPEPQKEVFKDYKNFVKLVKKELPGTPIYFIAITLVESREETWPQARWINQKVRAYSAKRDFLHFIDPNPKLTGPDGRPDNGLFIEDKLHLNREGYKRWTEVIKPVIE